jgi:hypothetical protein
MNTASPGPVAPSTQHSEPTPQPSAQMAHVVRGAAAFLLVAGLAAVFIAGRVIINALGLLDYVTGFALVINGIALCLLGWSPAVLGRPPRHWSVLIIAFAISVALEIGKRIL